ncbi:MAG: adenosylcobinamide-phosphate synthase CbiB [Cellulosilyticaceae bacterium]
MTSTLALCIGFIIDLIVGDPYWMPHPVRWIGNSIRWGEKGIRRVLPKSKNAEWIGGGILTCVIVVGTFAISFGLLRIVYAWHSSLGFVLECIMYYQILATKCLKVESMKVYEALKRDDLEGARYAVSMIVGRDTKQLTAGEVAKAAVETVAENTSDGIIAPLFYCALGGAPFGLLYKAINTLDSMIGYRNDKYYYFGTVAAKLDDVANLIPARLSALLMIVATWICKLNVKNAVQVYLADRYAHKSPNSAHTEAVAAGALGVQLAGDAFYFGKKVKKPTIGKALRTVSYDDICKVNQLMYTTAFLMLVLSIGWRMI